MPGTSLTDDLTSGLGNNPLMDLKWQEQGQVGCVAQILEFLSESMCFRTKRNLVSCLPPPLFPALQWNDAPNLCSYCCTVTHASRCSMKCQMTLFLAAPLLSSVSFPLETSFPPLGNCKEYLDFQPGGPFKIFSSRTFFFFFKWRLWGPERELWFAQVPTIDGQQSWTDAAQPNFLLLHTASRQEKINTKTNSLKAEKVCQPHSGWGLTLDSTKNLGLGRAGHFLR